MAFDFLLPCPRCGHRSALQWERMRWQEGGTIDDRAASAAYECPHCASLWQHDRLAAALEKGRWETTSGEWIQDGELRTAAGSPTAWPHSIGFRIWAAYSPWYPWERLVRDWLAAQGDGTKIKAFLEQSLARPHRDEVAAVESEALAATAERLEGWPEGAAALLAAVDVQDGWLSILICAAGLGERLWIVGREEIHGDTSIERAGAWVDLARWADAYDWMGRKIQAVVIDAGYQQSAVLVSQRLVAARTMTVKGVAGWGRQELKTVRAEARGMKFALVQVAVDLLKLQAVNRLTSGEIQLSADLPREVIEELCSETLVWVQAQGRRKRQWRKVSADRANEALDCLVYALALARRIQPVLRHPAQAQAQADQVEAPADAAPPAPPRRAPEIAPMRRPARRRRGRRSGRDWF